MFGLIKNVAFFALGYNARAIIKELNRIIVEREARNEGKENL